MNFSLPTHCPSCNTILVWKGVDLCCTNKDCGVTLIKSLESFLIKCGVEGVTATSLVNWNVLTFSDLLSFVSDCSKSQDKFVMELVKHVFSKTDVELFGCMTFDGAGRKTIDKLVQFYGNGNLGDATRVMYMNGDLNEFPDGIGQTIVSKIEIDWKANLSVLRSIVSDHRWKPVAKQAVVTGSTLSGKSFMFTGTLGIKRSEAESKVKSLGGSISSSVSKTLNYLVCATDSWGSSSKFVKAQQIGVTILTEDEFNSLVQ